ncbi:SGNH/GDSL hydrolase family protein [Paenibacillus allorhizosphaerae]|uniref:Acetylxylan esterase n=1 Tax=Paenibacillus allorhizosphaerae TaxID=2849866 RepID=A0ABN7TKU4_9BACL|nr:SGNH/GDSL hydrolase family protein [Paenibacillus allorhizosphaerae]CAG7644508.1 Acetylxylan esterase [Paenibacillus allorhizosphaerae]
MNAKVVAFGDSITRLGTNKAAHTEEAAAQDKTYWLDALAAKFYWELVNSGVNGDTTSKAMNRIQHDVLTHEPDFVLISFGMNDHVMKKKNVPNVSPDQYETNLRSMAQMVRNSGAEPIFITTNYIDENKYYTRHDPAFYEDVNGAQAWLDNYIQIMRKVGEDLKIGVADVRAECDRYELHKFSVDGVHPNALGQSVYVKVVGGYLEANNERWKRKGYSV